MQLQSPGSNLGLSVLLKGTTRVLTNCPVSNCPGGHPHPIASLQHLHNQLRVLTNTLQYCIVHSLHSLCRAQAINSNVAQSHTLPWKNYPTSPNTIHQCGTELDGDLVKPHSPQSPSTTAQLNQAVSKVSRNLTCCRNNTPIML